MAQLCYGRKRPQTLCTPSHTLTCWCLLLTSLMGLTTSDSSEHCWYSCSTSLMLHCTLYHTVNKYHCLYMLHNLLPFFDFSHHLLSSVEPTQRREQLEQAINKYYDSRLAGQTPVRLLGSLTLSNFPDHLELHPAGSGLHFSAVIPL